MQMRAAYSNPASCNYRRDSANAKDHVRFARQHPLYACVRSTRTHHITSQGAHPPPHARQLCRSSPIDTPATSTVEPESAIPGMTAFLDSLKWDQNGLVAVIVQVQYPPPPPPHPPTP